MKTISLIFLIVIFYNAIATVKPLGLFKHNPPPPKGPLKSDRVTELYFTQKLDHFSTNNDAIWSQRYFVNDEFFDNNSSRKVAFLLLGGESEASEAWMTSGSWTVTARQFGALLFQLEHRFYGESQPFSNLAIENLLYLSSEQALADAANFIEGINEENSLDSDINWIVFGGSYSGSLAAWLRLKYPDLVVGAVSSSGPLLAKVDFSEYYQVVLADLEGSNLQCVDSLRAAMKQVDDLLLNPTENKTLTEIFNLCETIEEFDVDSYEVVNFYNSLAETFAFAAQYNGLLGFKIDDLCAALTYDDNVEDIYRLAKAVKLLFGGTCVGNKYSEFVELLRDTRVSVGLRQWYYQTCTEYGWYQSTNTEDNVWGKGCSVDFYINLCNEVFGPEFNETFIKNQVDKTNAYYGGTDIDVSNVVYVHGSLDPWQAIGLTETTNPKSPVIYIEGTSHCANMYDTTDDDPPQLTAAKEEVDRLIGTWLGIE